MTAVVTVDLQYDFCDERHKHLGRMEKAYCLPRVRELLAHARKVDWKVVHVATVHRDHTPLPRRLQDKVIPPFCIDGTPGALIIDGICLAAEVVVQKTSFSAFVSTDLAAHLAGDETVIVCGVASDCCILQTVFDASERYNKRVVVPFDATSASSKTSHMAGLRIIEKSAGIVVPTSTLVSQPIDSWVSHDMNDSAINSAVSAYFLRSKEALSSLSGVESFANAAARVAAAETLLGQS